MNTEQFLRYLWNNQDYLQDDPVSGLEVALETYKNYYFLTVVNPETGVRFEREFEAPEDLSKVYHMLCDLAK